MLVQVIVVVVLECLDEMLMSALDFLLVEASFASIVSIDISPLSNEEESYFLLDQG